MPTGKHDNWTFRLLDGSGGGRTIQLNIRDYVAARKSFPPKRIIHEGREWELIKTTGPDETRGYAPVWQTGTHQKVTATYRRDNGKTYPVTGNAYNDTEVAALKARFEEDGATAVEVVPVAPEQEQ